MIVYRSLKKQDISQIQKLALKAWLFTYKEIYTGKNIRKQVANYYSTKNLLHYFGRIKKRKEYFVVAADKGEIVGYAHIGKNKNRWEIFRIYVSPKKLGKGIGGRLIYFIEKFIKPKKVKSYVVYPHVKNSIAKNFYTKIGFKRKKSMDEPRSSICYQKNIR